ncbi:retrovirus-related pol polyprotein from transposon TNT 1-94 [Tanacetum coccineum]
MSEKAKDPEIIDKNISHKPIDYEKLNRLSKGFGKRFTPQQEMDAEQAFWLRISNPTSKPSDASLVKIEPPKKLPKVRLVNESLKRLKFPLARFDNVVKIRTTPDARTEYEWGFEHTKAVFNNEIIPFLKSLKEIFNVLDRDILNEIMELQDKDNTICKLKDMIKAMREKSKEEKVKYDYCEIETKNVERENSVAKFLSENGQLCNEINHVKQVFKEQFDSTKKTHVHSKEQSDSLIDKLNLKSIKNEDLKAQIQDKVFVITSLKNDLQKIKGKEIIDIATQIPSATTIVPSMFKLDLEPLAPRLLQNRNVHIKYYKYAQEKADILRGIVEQAKEKQPLDKELDFACKHAQRIQELLVYVRDTCPNAIKLNEKKVVVTPKNKVKKVRFAEPLTSSSNSKQVESSKTSDSNTPVLSSTGLKCSTSKCGSKPTGNKRNDRISQTPSRNMKNKVEAQPRKVNKKNRVVEPICDDNVKHSKLNANSDLNCATCKKSLFDDVHDKCLLDFVKTVNSRAKSTKKHKKQNIWKPTGHVFTEVGLKWKPTGITFTIVGNLCPLTRITSANVIQIVLWYLDSGCSKYMTGKHSQLMNFVSKFLSTVRFGNDHIARFMGYGDYQMRNVTILRVYYVKGLGHNLFFVGQFCDGDLEVAFRKNTCFIRNLEASKTKSWLWHRQLSHLNFSTINKLAKDGLARGIPRLKFQKDHLCSALIVDDYSRFTWVRFLRTKDEAHEAIIKCIKNIQVCLNATVRNVRTDNETKFLNQTLHEFCENFGISHQTSVARTPQQNGIVKRRNRTLVEAVDKKPDLLFFHVFGALCDPTNDNDDLGKLDAKADIAMASKQFSSGPGLQCMTPVTSSSGLVPNPFTPPPIVVTSFQEVVAPRVVVIADSIVSTSIDQDAPSSSTPST